MPRSSNVPTVRSLSASPTGIATGVPTGLADPVEPVVPTALVDPVEPVVAQTAGGSLGILAVILATLAYLYHRAVARDDTPGDEAGPVAPEPPPSRELILDLPGGITLDAAEQSAVVAAHEHLAADGTAGRRSRVPRESIPDELVDAVYPDHHAGYGDPEEWYGECVGPALAVLTPLDPPLTLRDDVLAPDRSGPGPAGDAPGGDERTGPAEEEPDDPAPEPPPRGRSTVRSVRGPGAGRRRTRGGIDRDGETARGAAKRAERFDHELLERREGKAHVAVEDGDHVAGFLVENPDGRPTIRVRPGDGTRADLDWLASAREYLWERAVAGELIDGDAPPGGGTDPDPTTDGRSGPDAATGGDSDADPAARGDSDADPAAGSGGRSPGRDRDREPGERNT